MSGLPSTGVVSVIIAAFSSDSVSLSRPSLSKSSWPSWTPLPFVSLIKGSVPIKASSESFTPSLSSSLSTKSGIPSKSVSIQSLIVNVTAVLIGL